MEYLNALQSAAQQLLRDESAPLPGLQVLRSTRTTPIDAVVYHPVVCLILQGEKVVSSGTHSVTLSAGQALLVSHDLPVVSKITRASARQPYLALVLALDIALARSLAESIGDRLPPVSASQVLSCHPIEANWCEPLMRYLALRHDPLERELLGPVVMRELVFRLLMSPIGIMLRNRLRAGSHADRIAQAITYLQREFRSPLTVADLAGVSNMSTSSFHEHFKAATGTTPLQFQKDLRLIEARSRLVGGEGAVSTVAFDVGYESATQFSREYTRKYGSPPSADLPRAHSVG